MQPPLRARSFLSDQQCRSPSASAIRPVPHSVPSQLSIVARPYEDGLMRSWRADSLSWSVARSRNYPMCENSSARRARRNISKKLRSMESNRAARTMFDTLLENCIFYISQLYEFSHRLVPQQTRGENNIGILPVRRCRSQLRADPTHNHLWAVLMLVNAMAERSALITKRFPGLRRNQ